MLYDSIIIGGSYSGLSAAMALGRSLRKVLIIDNGQPCNRQTPHSHNFLTQDGETPLAIQQKAREQVLRYSTVSFLEDLAIAGTRTEEGFSITTASGQEYQTRKLLFAAGVRDLMPDIPGFAECKGRTLIHCPYSHGYEVAHQKTGVLANGDFAFHYVQLLLNLTGELTLFTNGSSTLSKEQEQLIRDRGVSIIETAIRALEQEEGQLKAVLFHDGSGIELPVLYSRPAFEQHCQIPLELGCELNDMGLLQVDC